MTQSSSPPDRLVLALAQINCVVGAIDVNLEKARAAREEAKSFGADLVMFSELFLAGYPPEDLVLKPAFLDACRAALEELARDTADGGPGGADRPAVDAGRVLPQRLCPARPRPHRCGALQGRSAQLWGVRREARVRVRPDAGAGRLSRRAARPADLRGYLGAGYGRIPGRDRRGNSSCRPTARLIGAARTTNASPSPPRGWSKAACRWSISTRSAARTNWFSTAPVSSSTPMAPSPAGCRLSRRRWRKIVFGREAEGWVCVEAPQSAALDGDEADYAACVLGLRDYVEKNGFPGVVLGLSGGVDSALCAAMAADALGPEKVHAIMLPYRFTSDESLRDAAGLRSRAGLALRHTADRAGGRGRRAGAGAAVRGNAARRHRRKYPGARARHRC